MTLILRYLGILYLAVIGMNNTRKAAGIYKHANLGSARDHLGRKAARFFSVQSRGTMTDFEITTYYATWFHPQKMKSLLHYKATSE